MNQKKNHYSHRALALLLTLSKQPRVRMPKHLIGMPNLRCTNPKCITHSETYLPMDIIHTKDGERCVYCDHLVEHVPEPEVLEEE